MFAPETPNTCSACGTVVPAWATFCPECGARLGDGEAQAQPPPRRIRIGAAAVLLVLTGAAVGGGIGVIVVGHWIAGAILFVVGAALLGAYAAGAAEQEASPGWLASVRGRGRAALDVVSAQARARREIVALKLELQRLASERPARLRALGEAVYAGDEPGTATARAELEELDAVIAAKEEQMTEVSERAQERTAEARFEASATRPLEPPQPPQEPYPPPDEGTPPTPEPVPEPYPPPDEGDPPRQP